MPPMRHRIVRATALVSVLLLPLAACSRADDPGTAAPPTGGGATVPGTGAPATDPPATTPKGTRPPKTIPPTPDSLPPVDWTPCGRSECGTVEVPLDYADPDGEQIELAVVRRPATDPSNRVGSIFVNPGGPGASGVEYVRVAGLSKTLNTYFDVVSWDPRGVGQSTPMTCGSTEDAFRELDWSPDTDAEQRALDDAAKTIADECERTDGELLPHLTTDDTARDLDRLRVMVGDDQLTYLGYSYGTHIGLRYADLFPDKVRAMVLDGVVDPTQDLPEMLTGQTDALEVLVDELFTSCDTSTDCPVQDPAATYDRVAAEVERKPLPAGTDTLGPTALAFGTVSSSYDASMQPMFLRGLAAAGEGDGTLIRGLAQTYWSSGSYAAYLGVLCVDSPHPEGAEDYRAFADELAKDSPRFGAPIANEVLPCAFWKAPTTGRPGPVRAAGAPPILVVGNTGDVATPFESAEKVAGDLESGVLLTYHGKGHTSYGKNGCVNNAVDAYLVDLVVPPEGTVCP